MPTELIQSLRIDAADLPSEAVIFGSTSAMRRVHGQIVRILDNDLPVLIRGESGTGKEVIARFLHARSNRCDLPFVKVNCSAIPASLLEGELLGKGVGGAPSAERGLMELAAGGTLFLDEIGDLNLEMQAKVLDLLEERREGRIGGVNGLRVRVICATDRNLEQAVEQRTFRRDLFYRIDVIRLNLLPLRERKEDIPGLCDHFLGKLAKKFDRAAPELSEDAIETLSRWSWPGNLHELENRLARLMVLGEDRSFETERYPRKDPTPGDKRQKTRTGRGGEASRPARPTVAKTVLLRALQANRWNRRKAAEDLHLSYHSLLSRLREMRVHPGRRGRIEPPHREGPA